MTEVIVGLLCSSVWISALVGFFFWLIQRQIKKRDAEAERKKDAIIKEHEAKEKARRNNDYYMIRMMNANMTLAEATARAVQRIPDAKCNGDMHRALESVETVKREYKAFMYQQGIEHLHEE